ncbi:MAG: sulfatase [Deltaproteobacteria bacterium]|nr:sulfatase [Deltaproteobacteria bacterium]
MRGLAALLAVALVCGFLGCAPAASERTVILISVDTLRADALGGFGAASDASQNLDAFLSDAVRFTNAYPPEPHTLPAHATLLTSLHPVSHGVAGRLQGGIELAAEFPTLAEILKAEGFATAAFVNGGFLHPRFGLDRGFETYDYFGDLDTGGEEVELGRTAAETNTRVFEWLDGRADQDAFLFIHYFDVHSDAGALPYDSPARYRSHGLEGLRWGSNGGSQFLISLNQTGNRLPGDRLDQLRALYAAGVRYTDDRLGDLFRGLKERRRYDDALILLVADHGEEFQEHGKFLHTQLYEETMRIPMAIRLPAGSGGGDVSVPALVALADVVPTVLDLLEIAAPPGLQGESLLPLIRGERSGESRRLFFTSRASGTMALRDGRWKLIYTPRMRSAELYDLEADPDERNDLSGSETDKTRESIERLLAWYRAAPRPFRGLQVQRVKLDDETTRQLRALGYVQGAPTGGPPDGG